HHFPLMPANRSGGKQLPYQRGGVFPAAVVDDHDRQAGNLQAQIADFRLQIFSIRLGAWFRCAAICILRSAFCNWEFAMCQCHWVPSLSGKNVGKRKWWQYKPSKGRDTRDKTLE